MAKRFVLTAFETADCPVYGQGQKMLLTDLTVVKEDSDHICYWSLAAFLQAARKAQAEGKSIERYACSAAGKCQGTFLVREVEIPRVEKTRSGGATQKLSFVETLMRIPFFAPLPVDSLAQISAKIERRHVAPKTDILRVGAPGEHFFMLLAGKVHVIEVDAAGTERIIATLGPHSCFGEMSLLTGEQCSATVRTVGDCEVLSLAKTDFEEVLDLNPSLNRYFTKLLAERLRVTNRQILDEIERGVMGKLSMITLPELAQAMTVSGRTGTLNLFHKARRGQVLFRDGQIYEASLDDRTGEEVFYEMMGWETGTFRFEQGPVHPKSEQPMDTMSLLMEGFRRLDEKRRGAARPAV
jgi:CRP/FNR family cyclic AMP-dependent transcriptional regulator